MNRVDQCLLLLSGLLLTAIFLFIAWNGEEAPRDRVSEDNEHPGRRVFQEQGCNACHSVDGSPNTGPTMRDLFGSVQRMRDGSTVQVDEPYMRTSIRHPERRIVEGYPDNMPSYDHLSEQKVKRLIAYLKKLSGTKNHGP